MTEPPEPPPPPQAPEAVPTAAESAPPAEPTFAAQVPANGAPLDAGPEEGLTSGNAEDDTAAPTTGDEAASTVEAIAEEGPETGQFEETGEIELGAGEIEIESVPAPPLPPPPPPGPRASAAGPPPAPPASIGSLPPVSLPPVPGAPAAPEPATPASSRPPAASTPAQSSPAADGVSPDGVSPDGVSPDGVSPAAAPSASAAPAAAASTPPAATASERPAPSSYAERAESLRAEIADSPDDPIRAALLFELGALLEDSAGDTAGAVKEYLKAFNADASFHPPLAALLRIFERRRSAKNLGRLYDAERKAAATPRQEAEAAVDRGAMAEDFEGTDGSAHFRAALEADETSPTAALMLERSAWVVGDAELALEAVSRRAESTSNDVIRGLLLTEIGRAHEADGDIEAALEVLQRAARGQGAQFRALAALESIARKHGRNAERAIALEGEAALAGAAARGEGEDAGSGAFSVKRFSDQRRAAHAAIAGEYEAARVYLDKLGDAAKADSALGRALALAPDDELLALVRQEAAQAAGDLEHAEAESARLLERFPQGPLAARLLYRRAEIARLRGNDDDAREALSAAAAASSGSVVPDATLEDLRVAAALHGERMQRLAARANALQGEARGQQALHAAQIAADDLPAGDGPREASPLFRVAAADSPRPTLALREWFAASERADDAATAKEALTALLTHDIDPEERAECARHLIELSEDSLGAEPGLLALDAWVQRSLEEGAEDAAWAPAAARLRAALANDLPRLAQAHLAEAMHAADAAQEAAHLCAAGRALARAGGDENIEQAVQTLRQALERVPGHPYALSLLEDLLRSRGDADEVVALLREAAQGQQDARAAELSLLLAGAAAEAAGDAAAAAQTYEEAADRDPDAIAPLLSMRRLGRRQRDETLYLRALEGLSEHELGADAPGAATLALGEYYDLVGGKTPLAEGPLSAATAGADVGAFAALDLLLLPENELDPGTRLGAIDRLLELAPEDAPWLLRERALTALTAGHDPGAAEEALAALSERGEANELIDVARLASYVGDAQSAPARAESLNRLALATPGDAGFELGLHAVRAGMVSGSEEAEEDAFMAAQGLAVDAPGSLAAAFAVDETSVDVDDPHGRADAALAHLGQADASRRGPERAAAGRALGTAGRAREACELLEEAIAEDAADLASIEALRVAAREAGLFARVAWAAETLADELEAHGGADLLPRLLEEAAAVRMDHLGEDEPAEALLRRASAADPTSRIAYGRLHDLLAERDDTAGLLELTTARIQLIHDSEELVKLFYEQARLRRADGDLAGALEALENLDMLDEVHEGAIALSVEVRVASGDYRGAVEGLDRLAECDVPIAQKRLVRLGAADFLAKRLDDPEGALARLEALLEISPGDASLFERMARIAEDAGLHTRAADCLERAAEASEGPARAAHYRAAGALRADHGDDDAAVSSYRRALTVLPTDQPAATALADLLIDPAERRAMAESFEQATWARIERDGPTSESLTGLRHAAVWRSERDLEYLTLSALGALGLANEEEAQAHEDRTEIMSRSRITGTLSSAGLAKLRPRPLEGPEATLAAITFGVVAKTTGLDLGAFGVGRSDLVPAKKASALRDSLEQISSLFGLEGGGLYVGGANASALSLAPGKQDRATWIVGAGLSTPLTRTQRFEAARRSVGLHDKTLPLVLRSAEDAATLLFAVASAAQAPLAAGATRSGVNEWASAMSKSIGWLERRSLAEAAAAIPDGGAGLVRFCADARRTSLRAGLVISGGLSDALTAVLGAMPTLENVAAHAEARDLLLFWISDTHVALRRELGLAK